MGDVEAVKADLEALLVAARVVFPERATMASEAADLLATEISRLDLESARAGDPRVLRHALRFCGDVHAALKLLVESLNYCSQGLIEMVDGYRSTDLEGAAAFEQIRDELREGPPPEPAPVPPDLGRPETPGTDTRVSTPEPQHPDDMLDEHEDELESQPEAEIPEVRSR